MHSRWRKPTDPTSSGKTLEAAAGGCAARNMMGSWGLFLAVLQSGFLKRHYDTDYASYVFLKLIFSAVQNMVN